MRRHRALPPPSPLPSRALPEAPPHPAVPRGSIPGLRHSPRGKQGHVWARDQRTPALGPGRAPPAAPGSSGSGPSAAHARARPTLRRAGRWGGRAGDAEGRLLLLWVSRSLSGSPASLVGVPRPLGATCFIPHPVCAPRHPSAQSLCPQSASLPQSRPAWRAGDCPALFAVMGGLGASPPARGFLGTRCFQRPLGSEVYFAKPRFA